MSERLLLTGVAGSIGIHTLSQIMKNTDWEVVGIDSFRHRGWCDRVAWHLKDHPNDVSRIEIITHDLTAPFSELTKKKIGHIDYIINMASLSDVEASIQEPVPFFRNNLDLVLNILEYAREVKPKAFIQISCYDEKTRSVTKDGLKYYWELKMGDEVLTLNSNRIPEFQKVEKIIVQDYEGEMVGMRGNTDVLVTPNHRMYDENMNVMEAGKIKNRFVFPTALATENKESSYLLVDDVGKVDANSLMYIMGVFIGDGFTAYQEKIQASKSGLNRKDFVSRKNSKGQFISGRTGINDKSTSKSYRIFFDIPEKDKARKRLEKTLTSLGLKWHSQKGKSGEHIYFTSKELLEFFDAHIGKGAANKRIPKFVWKLGKNNLKALYDGLIDSDGCYRKLNETYTTISNSLMSDVVLLAYLLGNKASNYYKYSESSYEGRVIKGGANQVLVSHTEPLSTKQISSLNYKGKIWCIALKNKNFLVERNGKFYFSGNTDEVYGPTTGKNEGYEEWATLLPSNPYAASKAAQEMACIAWWRSYGVPLIITNTMNNFGEMQSPSKYPVIIQRALARGEKITIHSIGDEIGSRSYIHSRNFADALVFLIKNIKPYIHEPGKVDRPDRFHIAGDRQIDNRELVELIAELMGKKDSFEYELVDVHSTRPGHDPHYGLKADKIAKLGWKAPLTFEESLANTIKWQTENSEWIK